MKRSDILPKIKELTLQHPNLHQEIVHEVLRIEGINLEKVDIKQLNNDVKVFLSKFKSKFILYMFIMTFFDNNMLKPSFICCTI